MSMYKNVTWNGTSFWHGTSSIFLESIRNTGLGAINPSKDYKLLEVLQFLYTEVHRNNIHHWIVDKHKTTIEATLAQTNLHINGVHMNFKHEGTFVSASANRASHYACLNIVGSELLENVCYYYVF